MKEQIALLIEWDPLTGKRAGNIDPRAPGLLCNGWQNMDLNPAIELKIIDDNRDPKQYENTPGVKILHGKTAINNAIDENFPITYQVTDEILYKIHISKHMKEIDFKKLSTSHDNYLKQLKTVYGIVGIKEIHPIKI